MGDSRRFDEFAKLISKRFKPCRVADIAGGKGYLNLALSERGFTVTTFDKRSPKVRVKAVDTQHRYFTHTTKGEFDLLVGMHPDEATDVIIVEAARRDIPFAIVPCCIKPYAAAFWKKHTFSGWVQHLLELATKRGFTCETALLRIEGRNLVIIGTRSDEETLHS